MNRTWGQLQERHGVKLRFLLVGAWNTIFGYAAFVVLDTLLARMLQPRYWAYMTAAVLSHLLAVANAYVFHRRVTFRSATRGRRMLAEYLRFNVSYLGTFFLGLVLLPLGVERLHWDPKAAAAVTTLLVVFVSYLAHSRFSFREGRTKR